MSETTTANDVDIADLTNKLSKLCSEDPAKAFGILLDPELLATSPDDMLLELFKARVEIRTAERLRTEPEWSKQVADADGPFRKFILMLKFRFFGLAERMLEFMMEPLFDEIAEAGPLRDAIFARPKLRAQQLVLQWHCSGFLIRNRPISMRSVAFVQCVDELILLAKTFGLDSHPLSFVKHRHDDKTWEHASAVVDEIESLAQIVDPEGRHDTSTKSPLRFVPNIAEHANDLLSSPDNAQVDVLLADARRRLLQCHELLEHVHSLKRLDEGKTGQPSEAVDTEKSPSSDGTATFNYSSFNGRFRIGEGRHVFETVWSKASDTSIHCYTDSPTLSGIALAPRGAALADITDASALDFTSRVRTPEEGRFVVLQNTNGFYAALQILDIKDDTRGDQADELSFRYWILRDGSTDFSKIQGMSLATQSASQEPTMSTSLTPPRVLISYSHDSDAHAKRVLDLANRLRRDGINCRIDQYVTNPSEGWPLWMDNEVEEADFVLVLFTERYATRSREPRKSGVRFESVLILQDLYEAGLINDKFVPVLFDGADSKHIVKWLKLVNYYTVDGDAGYESLRRRLLNDPAVVMPPLGIPTKKGPANP